MSIVKEFRDFAMKGNVVDLAVGVIIGAAFGKIVSSMVDNILMPFIGILLQGVDFKELSFTLGKAQIKYGLFIGAVIDFLIIAFVLFLIIKGMTAMQRKEAIAEAAAPAEPSSTDKLLMEIRDELKK